MKKGFKYYKHRYKFHKEMHTHYEDLYNVAFKEMRFKSLERDHLLSVLDEVEVLLSKNCKPSLIQKVIELGKTRAVLDQSIHYDLECGGIKGFNNNK